MFKIRFLFRVCIIYFILFFLISFWYLTKFESSFQSTHRLAVIVPYRNRSKQLEIFLSHMNSFLNFQSINHIFIIVNQIDKHRFNRGALINIGFIESRLLVDYIVMHDVDLLPLNVKQLSYQYPENGPIHLASPKYHPIYHYPTYVGGILIMTCKDFERINGMSPLYWGWGREDDNFYVRMKLAKMRIYRPNNLLTNYTNTFRHLHDNDMHRRDYAKYGNQIEEGKKIYPQLGFNTTKYQLINKKIKKTSQSIEYIMLDVKIECDYSLSSWCDHSTNISK